LHISNDTDQSYTAFDKHICTQTTCKFLRI
jgi:hypothetical protein